MILGTSIPLDLFIVAAPLIVLGVLSILGE
jgi:hypothetical protein